MKLAVISDLHGNYYALAKVLAFLRSQEIDGIIGLGDFVTDGPFPQRMMRVLREMQEEFPCYLVRGNREEYLLQKLRMQTEIPTEFSGRAVTETKCREERFAAGIRYDFFLRNKNRNQPA